MDYISKIKEMAKNCQDNLDYDYLELCIDSFKDYANTVIDYATKIEIVKERYSGDIDAKKDAIIRYDTARHNAHEAAISSVAGLNRFCERNNLEPFVKINVNNRHEVAEFVGNFVNQVYNDTIRGGMDKAVELAQERGDTYRYPKYEVER